MNIYFFKPGKGGSPTKVVNFSFQIRGLEKYAKMKPSFYVYLYCKECHKLKTRQNIKRKLSKISKKVMDVFYEVLKDYEIISIAK